MRVHANRNLVLGIVVLAVSVAVGLGISRAVPQSAAAGSPTKSAAAKDDPIVPVVKSDAEWQKLLPPETYHVMREAGTEIAFTGRYWNNHASGTYVCAACGLPLFSSRTKYDSGTGWPSYWQPIAKTHVATAPDSYMGQVYSEVLCARCGGHLGHVFDDGPPPTGLRYCIDSVALKFVPAR